TVREIPEPYREPLLMYYRQNQAVCDIAAALQITEENARKRITRGRAFLKEAVEKQVESMLESTRPGSAFTLAVLAALPLAATASGCAVTTTAATVSGCGIIGKGIGVTSFGFFSWLIGAIWIALGSIVIPLASLFGGFHVVIKQVQNSPTIRSRRFLIRESLIRLAAAMFLMGGYFFVVSLPCSVISFYGKSITIMILAILFFSSIGTGAIFVNQIWRKIIEEDTGLRSAPELPLEKSWLSLRTLRLTFGVSLSMFCLGLAGFMYFIWDLSHGFPPGIFSNVLFYGFLLLQILPIGLFINTYQRTIKMASETGLEQYPPLLPNILDIVLGKAEMPQDKKTLRGRMGGDMIAMGALIFSGSTQTASLGLMQPNPWPGYLVIVVSIFGFLLFAIFVAGKPKVRHLGWMLTSWLFAGFYGWILWGGAFDAQFNAMPTFELAVLFIYALFFFSGVGGFCGYIGLFEKEINRKLGI
ncbi:MAG: RNA polymerase sigma factor, partial [Thermoguttaceae bacterium]